MRVLQLKTLGLMVATAAALCASGCGDVARTGRSPGFLIIDSLDGASGATPTEFGNTVRSDVITLVKKTIGAVEVEVPTVFNDLGRVTMRIGLKNPGSIDSPTSPSPLNAITITRYRVVFKRTDGRNTQGVDVPYAFDGGATVTIPEGTTAGINFELVRHSAKEEPPLKNLAYNGAGQLISTIADISFYGTDQAGNDVIVTGSMSVNFGDFGDPE